jgi:putative hemolysin
MQTERYADQNIFSLKQYLSNPVFNKLLSPAAVLAEHLFKLRKLEHFYKKILEKESTSSFVDTILDVLNIRYEVSDLDLYRIPREGMLVVVANHPFGTIDGIILGSILQKRRHDVKIMANYVLRCIPQMHDLLLFVDPYGGETSARKNLKPLKDAISWLKDGGALAVFPAGEVSYLYVRKAKIADPQWNTTIAGIIRRTGATVLPVYFDGVNSGLFQAAGLIHRRLRTILLPRELLKKCNTTIRVRIGNPLPADRLAPLHTDDEVMACLRSHTYALKYREKFMASKRGGEMSAICFKKNEAETMTTQGNCGKIALEIQNIPSDQILLENSEYMVIHAKAHQIPNGLYEIGRLREESFKRVGEGTGRQFDLDRFDLFYTHILLWNKEKNEIVGAYRIGCVDQILSRFGKKGLYTNTLFHFKPGFFEQINQALELGRSFVRIEYQKKYTPLFFLWKGIGHFVAQHPHYKILFGPVTISNNYSMLSRELIVSFLKKYHYTRELAGLVRTKTPITLKTVRKSDIRALSNFSRDIEELSDLISCIEHDKKGVPVLLKQYIQLGGRILGFNIDREFSNGLDGLIMVDLTECNTKLLSHYMGQKGVEKYLAYHRNALSLDMAS